MIGLTLYPVTGTLDCYINHEESLLITESALGSVRKDCYTNK